VAAPANPDRQEFYANVLASMDRLQSSQHPQPPTAHVARLAAAEIAAVQGLDAQAEGRLAKRLENYFLKFFKAKGERS
jgi:hypothetical protein